MIDNPNVNKKLYICQYLKETFISNATNETNDIYDKLSWGLMSVLTNCIQYTDTTVDTQTKNETNLLAIELLDNFLNTSSPKEMIMVYSEGISNLSEINTFNDVNEIENETLLFNQLYQYIYICKAIINALGPIKTKNKYQFIKNVINILNKGLKSVELLSKRYNQYYFDKINNESTQNDELYEETEKNLLNELIDFYLYAMDKFMELFNTEIEKIPESQNSTQLNIVNALTNPKTEAEIQYYLVCFFLFKLCQYGLAYTFTGSSSEFNRININKYKNIIDNYKLKGYILTKWFSKLITVASELHLDISKFYYINSDEKYNQIFNDVEVDETKISFKYPFSMEGRSVLLSKLYALPLNPYFTPIDDQPEHQLNALICHLFPKILNPSYIFYSSFDYLEVLMNLNQDIGVVSHVISAFEYLKSITKHETVNLKDLKNINDINSINLLSILKTYVSLMVTVPYAIIRDKMYLLLKEFVGVMTEEARFSFIMEVIQNSYTESIVVLGIVLYKEAIHEAWMEEVYGNSENKKQNKKSLYFSTEFLEIIKKTLFNIKSPIYESFNTDLKFISSSNDDQSKEKETEKQENNEMIDSYLDTYEGFWKKFEILFQSLNLYSYLFLRDNKEKVIQIWNNNFNDDVEKYFLIPLKAKVQKWQRYVQEKEAKEHHAEGDKGHHHHHHQHTVNPYSYIPDCPEFQLVMMENMIEQLFALRKDFNSNNE